MMYWDSASNRPESHRYITQNGGSSPTLFNSGSFYTNQLLVQNETGSMKTVTPKGRQMIDGVYTNKTKIETGYWFVCGEPDIWLVFGNKHGLTSPNYAKYAVPGYAEPKDDEKTPSEG